MVEKDGKERKRGNGVLIIFLIVFFGYKVQFSYFNIIF